MPAFPDHGKELLTLLHGHAEHLQRKAEKGVREFPQKDMGIFDIIGQLLEELIVRIKLSLERPQAFLYLLEDDGLSLLRRENDPIFLQPGTVLAERRHLKHLGRVELVARSLAGGLDALD